MVRRLLQPENAPVSISRTDSGILTDSRLPHFSNEYEPIFATEPGIVIFSSSEKLKVLYLISLNRKYYFVERVATDKSALTNLFYGIRYDDGLYVVMIECITSDSPCAGRYLYDIWRFNCLAAMGNGIYQLLPVCCFKNRFALFLYTF